MDKEDIALILHNKINDNSPEDVIDIMRQAKWLGKILNDLGYKILMLPFSPDNIGTLAQLKDTTPMTVINLVDSACGEENLSYLAAGILEYLKVKFTGNSMRSLYITTDKIYAKKMLQSAKINTAQWVFDGEANGFVPEKKYIIKALSEDASIGLADKSVIVAESLDKLKEEMKTREKEIGGKVFAERYIEGREFNVCIYGNRNNPKILPPYEWLFDGFDERNIVKIITYDAKWTENTYEYDHVIADYHLPEKDNALLEELEAISAKCWALFELKGYARIDFRIDENGKPWVLEINCNPSLYSYRNIAREKGMDFVGIFKDIIEAE